MDDSAATQRGEVLLHCVRQLVGEPFLHLQALRKGVNEACQLGQSHNTGRWYVADGDMSREWKHVMFAD